MDRKVLLLLLLSLLLSMMMKVSSSSSSSGSSSGGGSYYPSTPPAYCSTNSSVRSIPPLSAADMALVDSLLQVQVLIRHGSRTLDEVESCWNNYNITWNNCNCTTLQIPSNSYTSSNVAQPWLFRKLYDGSPNDLGGNCETGQLLGFGYEQQQDNGRILRAAYLNTSSKLSLFNTTIINDIPSGQLYFRSDDVPRTLMSGQTLLSTMFNATNEIIIPWHLGDYNLDEIYPNSNACPRLFTASSAAYSSAAWKSYNSSAYIKNLTSNLSSIFGVGQWSWSDNLDCMMSTVCTGRSIPTVGPQMTDKLFNEAVNYTEFKYAYMALYNSSLYSKLALGRIAYDVRTRILPALNSTTYNNFVLYSGHDTTLMPFLAALLGANWDRKWASYASMVYIEIYNSSTPGSSQLFRVIYNGVQQQVPGCSKTGLCNISVLLGALSFGQENMPCDFQAVVSDYDYYTNDDDNTDDCNPNSSKKKDSKLSDRDWAGLCILSAVLGGLLGCSGLVFYQRRSRSSYKSSNGLVGEENRNALSMSLNNNISI